MPLTFGVVQADSDVSSFGSSVKLNDRNTDRGWSGRHINPVPAFVRCLAQRLLSMNIGQNRKINRYALFILRSTAFNIDV